MERAIREAFLTIPELSSIRVERQSGEVLVSLSANNPPKELPYRIYDEQVSLIESFRELSLAFRLIAEVPI